MAYSDLPLDLLRQHRTANPAPPDFRDLWAETLTAARSQGGEVTATPVENGLSVVQTWDVRFPGFGGHEVAAWLHVPRGHDGRLPCVVEYVGYGGGRGLSHERILWAAAGYAHLVMDTRGQGSGWSVGVTEDPVGSGPAYPGVLTRGVVDFETFYYRRLITDAVRAVDAARTLAQVDPDRVVVTGISQGGGVTIAAAALSDGLAGAMVDVPFLCDVPRALQLCDRPPYTELVAFLAVQRDAVDAALRTLSFVDGAHHAAQASVPALFSVALMDPTCPPSTVYAAYNAWVGEKEIVEYPFNGHEGGGPQHQVRQLQWLRDRLG